MGESPLTHPDFQWTAPEFSQPQRVLRHPRRRSVSHQQRRRNPRRTSRLITRKSAASTPAVTNIKVQHPPHRRQRSPGEADMAIEST
jgi:hypothetical protein